MKSGGWFKQETELAERSERSEKLVDIELRIRQEVERKLEEGAKKVAEIAEDGVLIEIDTHVYPPVYVTTAMESIRNEYMTKGWFDVQVYYEWSSDTIGAVVLLFIKPYIKHKPHIYEEEREKDWMVLPIMATATFLLLLLMITLFI